MEKYWPYALTLLKDQVNEYSYSQWFNDAAIVDVVQRGSICYICCSDEWVKSTLDQGYMHVLEDVLFSAAGEHLRPILVDLAHEDIPTPAEQSQMPMQVFGADPIFNPRYTFDTFVVGSSNRFAHAAALAVAESPSRAYNPLFIYGGSGLGKTHLMHAIGQLLLKKSPHRKVVYISSEKFTNEFIYMLGKNRMDAFQNYYRNCDVLLIDDIQFIQGKTQTQEEFFHTFNALHEAGKQIVISSDRPYNELNPLEERLRTRFAWGLPVDIAAPDWETRCAILQKKASGESIALNDDVIYFVADKVSANIRELEGALNRILCYGQINRVEEIDLDVAREALKDILPTDEAPKLNISLIQKVVANHYGITVDDLKSTRRDRSVSFPRQVAMYLCRELLGATQPQIGKAFGDRDHTTVIHAYNKINKDRRDDQKVENNISEIERTLLGRPSH